MMIKDQNEFSPEWHARWNNPDPTREPSEQALQAKRAWMRAYGLGEPSDLSTVRQSKSFSRALAEAYRDLEDNPHDGHVLRAYGAFIAETKSQYALLVSHGMRPLFTTDDPYPDMPTMLADVKAGNFRVYKTGEGEHSLLTPTENDLFRAVHDFFGHCATGRTFDRHGEEGAYRSHAEMYSPLARQALATETRGQNAGLIWTGNFVEQKAGLLPAWAWRI